MKYNVSVVIPVFNDADALPELLSRLRRVSAGSGYLLDVVLVDDGSGDKVWSELEGLARQFGDMDIAVLRLDKNHGQHPATIQGLLVAKGDFIITMDADLQHPPEFIPILANQLAHGNADVAYATCRGAHGLFRRLIGTARRLLVAPLGTSLVKASSFRVIRSSLLDSKMRAAASGVVNLDEFLSWEANKVSSVPAPHHPRKYNVSSYTPGRLLAFALWSAWSTRHLSRAVCILGVGFVVIGISAYMVRSSVWGSLPFSLFFGVGSSFIIFGLLHRFAWRYHNSKKNIHVIKTIKTR